MDVKNPVDIVETFKKIRQARESATDARKKFEALADREEADTDEKSSTKLWLQFTLT